MHAIPTLKTVTEFFPLKMPLRYTDLQLLHIPLYNGKIISL